MAILPKPDRCSAEPAIGVWVLPDFLPDGGGYGRRVERLVWGGLSMV